MLDRIKKNKEWLFSGVAVSIPLAIVGWLWFSGGDPSTVTDNSTVQQNNTGAGYVAGGNQTFNNDNPVQQTHSGSGDIVGRDKVIHQHLYRFESYQEIVQMIKDEEEVLANIAPDKANLRVRQSVKVQVLKQRLEELKKTDATLRDKGIPQNDEKLKKEREADKKKLLTIDQNLKKETQELYRYQPASYQRNRLLFGDYDINLRESARQILKWQEPKAEGMMTWGEANEYVAEKNTEGLMGYHDWRLPAIDELQKLADFIKNFPDSYSDINQLYWSSEDVGPYSVEAKVVNLGSAQMSWNDADERVVTRLKNNRFSVRLVRSIGHITTILMEYEEALKHHRSLAEQNPETYLPNVASTLLSLSIFYLENVPNKAKSVAYAQEARDILLPLCNKAPHLQKYLDIAEGLLEDNKAKPEA